MKNSSLGASFALGENFGESTDSKSSFIPKISTNTKFPPQILEFAIQIKAIQKNKGT